MGTTVVNTHGTTGTFYFGEVNGEQVSGVIKGSESIYLDKVFRTDIATSEEDMKAASDSLAAADKVGAVSDGQ